ncbi:MAG: dihydroneopterin aldolase [Chthonomonadales bacterium]
MKNSDLILIEQIEFYAFHGASDEEQSVGHRYSVDVELSVDTTVAGVSDAIADTINYSHVSKRIVLIGTTEQYRLLERLAARLAEVVLGEFSVNAVRLRVKKLRPPMNVIASAVGVEIYRERA